MNHNSFYYRAMKKAHLIEDPAMTYESSHSARTTRTYGESGTTTSSFWARFLSDYCSDEI